MTKRLLAAFAAALMVVGAPSIAAASVPPTEPAPDVVITDTPVAEDANVPVLDSEADIGHEALENTDSVGSIKLSTENVNRLMSLALPIILGIVMKYRPKAMVWVGIIAQAVKTMIVQATTSDGSAILNGVVLNQFIEGLIIQFGFYFHILKPNGITNAPGGKLPSGGI